jgi:hypothetical protein
MTTEASAQQAKTGTDLDTLEKTVTLPRRPRAAQWRKSLLGGVGLGPTDWQLLAVLEYSEEDARALLAELKPLRGGASGAEVEDGGWLPGATRTALNQAKAYDASAFFRSPLRAGSLYHLPGSNTFVLSLFTL